MKKRKSIKLINVIIFIGIMIAIITLSNCFKEDIQTMKQTISSKMINRNAQSTTINNFGGGLEVAYAEWENIDEATGYNVYVKQSEQGESAYTQVDTELIRKYEGDYWRVDVLGLEKGTYTLKIVPIINGQENIESQLVTNDIQVETHDRTGFAWVNGETNGAYNANGTLKQNAVVLYVTEETKDTISLDVVTNSKGETTNAQGLQNILDLYKKGYDSRPLNIRIIGKVTDPSVLDGGDIVISGNSASKRLSCGMTIEGVGEDATAYGYGIRIKNASNIEIRNLAIMLSDSDEGDNIGLQQENDHIWVHNCDFFYGEAGSDSDQAKGDGALDCKKSTYVTFSYNHFFDNGKVNLLGLSEDTTEGLYITYHHNWYDHSDSRHPRCRFYSAHVYNNYYDGNAKYGIGACLGSSVFAESNYFRNCVKPMMISMQGSDTSGTFSSEDGGMIKAYNNYMVGQKSYIAYTENHEDFDAYEVSTATETVPSSVTSLKGGNIYNNFDTSDIMYTYTADTPEKAKEKVKRYAGRLNGGDFKWEFTSEDDEDDGVNADLKEALENYETSLLSVGGNSIPTEPSNPEEPSDVPVESISLNITNKTIKIGETVQLTAEILPENATNKKLIWSTDDEKIATVNQEGLVTAISTGETIITVTTEDGKKKATCEIVVMGNEEKVVATIEYSETDLTNKDVVATIYFNKEDVRITNNDEKNTYTFTTNDSFVFEYVDSQNTTGTATATVNWIDKILPTITGVENDGKYESPVTPVITDENLKDVQLIKDGTEINGYENGQEIAENGEYIIIATDKAGNETKVEFTIDIPIDDTITSVEYDVNMDSYYIKNIQPETELTTFKKAIFTEVGYTVFNLSGNQVLDNEMIGTGYKLITDTGKEYVLIVMGDLNGDGEIKLTDLSMIRKHYLALETLTDEYEKAADVDNNGNISLNDISLIRKMILGI